jgi:hypothetical protein
MNSLSLYDNIEINDIITMPLSFSKVKEGKIVKIKGSNQHAKSVLLETGEWFHLSRYVRDYVLTVEESN